MVKCADCGKEISTEEYESFDELCWVCWSSKEYGTLDYTLTLERRAFVLEKEGKFDKAKRIYWQIINDGFPGSFPYERLRMICAKQEDWKGAIKACRAYIDSSARHIPGYNVKSERMKQWIRKYEAKLGIGDSTHITAEKILARALHKASASTRRRVQVSLPAFRPARAFPKWARGEIAFELIEVPEFQRYYPAPDFMNKYQLKFYKKWIKQWKKGQPVDVKGNITYLFAYTYDVIVGAQVNPRDALYELRLLQHVYRHEKNFSEDYLTWWVFDMYLLNSDYMNAMAYIESKRVSLKSKRANSFALSLKYKLGLPTSGNDVFGLSNRALGKIVLDNLDIVFDYLEGTVRDFEEENNVDLLALITEQFAHHASSEVLLFSGVPGYHPRIQLDYYDYSLLGDFNTVIDQWMKDAENALREARGLPKIGEGWLTETILYNIVVKIFSELGYEVVHHSYPPFLGRQELDIHIPALNLGIEYMGRQHYEPIEFFGGQEGLEKRQALDERKRKLCKENDLMLVYFRYDEPIEENDVRSKLDDALSNAREK